MGTPRKRGAQAGNSNAVKSGRKCAKLPRDCKYLEPRLRAAKDEMEAGLRRIHGEHYPPVLGDAVLLALSYLRRALIAEKRARGAKDPAEQHKWYGWASEDHARHVAELRKLGLLPEQTTANNGGNCAARVAVYIPENNRPRRDSKPPDAACVPPPPEPEPEAVQPIETPQSAASASTAQIHQPHSVQESVQPAVPQNTMASFVSAAKHHDRARVRGFRFSQN